MNIVFLENSVFHESHQGGIWKKLSGGKKFCISLSPRIAFYSTPSAMEFPGPSEAILPFLWWLVYGCSFKEHLYCGFPAVFSVLEAKTNELNAPDNQLEKEYLFRGHFW